ncbi:hypothetical protein AJ78_04218 [Emergomyces pasteurianus Ep9510]|uniref:Uncharacterized protein n=1 Tax=Emergomyces pasteurianus Ep9510 TaxID=1447872 RepID=A0A1J9PHX9_9EURO|nr:hypothetical protein AJ78_04218 [Emergomyces pasteurianus Ep9510]
MSYQSQIPSVTLQDLHGFRARHFRQGNSESVHSLMLPVADDEHLNGDGLGYYPDGAKRTLTDQQIEIFRHSEIQKLQRMKRWKEMADRDQADGEFSTNVARGSLTDAGLLEGQGARQGSLEHEDNGFHDTEKSSNNMDKKPKEGTIIPDGNNIIERPPGFGAQGTTSSNSHKPASSGSNPYGRRLVSYDD